MDSAGQASETADLIARPSIASHKGGLVPIWAAGAVTSSWKNPSSSGQLPVPVALNARPPTLFRHYYTRKVEKSKYPFWRIQEKNIDFRFTIRPAQP